MKDIGAVIKIGPEGHLAIEQTFKGSRVGDIYVTCCNLAVKNTNCAMLVIRAPGCGSAYPVTLHYAWLRLMYAAGHMGKPKQVVRMRYAPKPMAIGERVIQYDDDARPDALHMAREQDGYRFWMASLMPFIENSPEGGVVLSPSTMPADAWPWLERIVGLLHSPRVRVLNDKLHARVREINDIDKLEEEFRKAKDSPLPG